VQTLGATAKDSTAKPSPVIAFLFQPLRMRITAFSDVPSRLHGHVTIFDGKPGGHKTKTIASKTLLGMHPDGSSAWFNWTPTAMGSHHLYAVIQNTNGTQPLGDLIVQVRRAPGDLNEDGRVDRHDLNMLSRDIGKTVDESACGVECDLDADGAITQKDADLMSQLCDSQDCAFARAEYVGGVSPHEPDMRAVRSADDTARSAFLAAHREDEEALSSASAPVSELYQAELQRKQGLRSIRYYYKGKPVTSGSFAYSQVAATKAAGSSNR
jgi:hypothetical protein